MKELLHFTADWCQPCKKLKPIIESYIDNHPEIRYTIINVDEQIDFVKTYSILSIPTLISLIDGEPVGRHSGVANIKEIDSLFN